LEYSKRKEQTPGVWKHKELPPVQDSANIVSLGESGTPLLDCPRLANYLGINKLYIKNETLNQTGAFKDRETSDAISMAKEFGISLVKYQLLLTGTAAVSLALYATRGGLDLIVFVQDITPFEKIVQAIYCGVQVICVEGIYEMALKLQIESCNHLGLYNCSVAVDTHGHVRGTLKQFKLRLT